jgi:hypothetical protein
MAINADKPHLWKADVAASVDLYNDWFVKFAPKTYRNKRIEVTKNVEIGLLRTDDLSEITPAVLQAHPGILPMLRMATCPPLASRRNALRLRSCLRTWVEAGTARSLSE